MTDQSLMSLTSDLPQIGYSTRTETDETNKYTRYIRGPKHQIFYRQLNTSPLEQFSLEKHFKSRNNCSHKPVAL